MVVPRGLPPARGGLNGFDVIGAEAKDAAAIKARSRDADDVNIALDVPDRADQGDGGAARQRLRLLDANAAIGLEGHGHASTTRQAALRTRVSRAFFLGTKPSFVRFTSVPYQTWAYSGLPHSRTW